MNLDAVDLASLRLLVVDKRDGLEIGPTEGHGTQRAPA